MYIAICDDVVQQAEQIKRMIEHAPYGAESTVDVFADSESLLRRMKEPCPPDIVFLDIELANGADGITVAKKINRQNPHAQILFITSYPAYAADIYEVEHVYLLVKPIAFEKLDAALEKAREKLRLLENERILIPVGSGLCAFQMEELYYFERSGRSTNIYSVRGVCKTSLKLNELEAMLPQKKFARPHNSYLVRLSQVFAIERLQLKMKNGDTIPVSNQHRATFRQALTQSI